MDVAGLLLDGYGRVPELVAHAVDGLAADDLTRAPAPGANTIAWLVWHLSRVEDEHISEQMGAAQQWVTGNFAAGFGRDADPNDTGYGYTIEQVAAVRPVSASALLEYHAAVHDHIAPYLAGLDATDLDRIVDERWNPPVTLGVRLVSVLDDCLQHAGQAGYVRGLLGR